MLVALWDVSNQFNHTNGSILTNGKIYVFYQGRGALAPTWSSADGSHVNPNPIILDNYGRAVAFADDQYSYTCVVCDFYGRELFSFDPAAFGTGGGGGSTEGGDAAHWIGTSGIDVQVTAAADTLLPLPANPDYEGGFVSQTTYTTMSLNPGLYMIDADIRIQQDDDDLENLIKDISVYTGLSGPDSLTTSQKNWTGPEASDDRHFIHVHFIRHVGEDGDDLYFQMNSPVNLSQAWIEKLSIVKLTEGSGKNYVGGYGIEIIGPVISVSGMIPETSAANFVDVDTYNTEVENIYQAIAETSGQIPSGVATEQWVTDYTSAFITEDALNGYATQQWVEDQNYITSADIPPIPQDVVTSGELATVSGDIVSQIPSLDGYATQDWVNEQGYLTSVPSEYVTQSEMEDYTSAFITSADIPDVPEDLVTSAELATVSGDIVNQIPDTSDMATKTWVGEQGYLTSIPEDLVTSAELASTSGDIVSQIPSVEGLASEQYVQDYTSAYITSADLPDVSDMATQTWVGEQGYITANDIPADLVTSGELATVSGDIMNEIPDTSDMATKTWVGQQGYLTSIPAEYATSGDLVTLSGAIEAEIPSYTAGDNISILSDTISVSGTAGLIAGDNISIVTSGDNYVISSTGGGGGGSDVEIIPSLQTGTKIADFVIDGTSGELYAPTGGGGLDQVYHDAGMTGDGTSLSPLSITSADNWTQAYDAINDSASYWNQAYNAIDTSAANWNDAAGMNEYPISAGPGMSIDDVSGVTVFQTSGTMMDDLIEYNSQDEISAYNGHPIMTVESEKQWLTHDDTICHVTNSAQYAFGVNVPVVARAMGTDETILWESPNSGGINASAYTLSESYDNFDRIKVYFRTNDGWSSCNETLTTNSKFPLSVEEFFTNNGNYISKATTAELDGTTMYVSPSGFISYRGGSGGSTYTTVSGKTETQKFYVNRIYGIGRKEEV